jgi:hypothetical protein
MLSGAPPGTYGTSHYSGWTTGDKFLEFLNFIYHVKSMKDGQVLLLLDNCDIHITVPAISKCRTKGVIMLTLPPHTSHKLQPLDRCVFGLFKKFYYVASNDLMLGIPRKLISIYGVAHLTGLAYPTAFIQSNIQSGFCVTGLWLVNSDIFTVDVFLNSCVTGRPEPAV